MKLWRPILGGITCTCLGYAACGFIGWGFWQLVDTVGPAAPFVLLGIVGLVAGLVWLLVEMLAGRS